MIEEVQRSGESVQVDEIAQTGKKAQADAFATAGFALKTQERAAQLEQEISAINFLVGVFTELPDEAFIEGVLSLGESSIGGAAGDELAKWIAEQKGRDVADVLLDVARDRVVLMRGVYEDGIKPPYESLWSDSDARSSIGAVNRFYDHANLQVTGEVKDAPDQLGVELSLMCALGQRELDALAAGDINAADEACELRCGFEKTHVRRWAPSYAWAMRAAAKTGFYRSVGYMIEELFGKESRDAAL